MPAPTLAPLRSVPFQCCGLHALVLTSVYQGRYPPPVDVQHVLWKTLEQWQQRAGLGRAPRTILDELGRIQSSDVVLPLADGSERELRIRCVVRPDRAQALLLERLGLEFPQRLRAPMQGLRM